MRITMQVKNLSRLDESKRDEIRAQSAELRRPPGR